MRYNPTRWVCQLPSKLCNGLFRVYGEDRPCPLAQKCLNAERITPFEYKYWGVQGQKVTRAKDPVRYYEHAKRATDLRRTFLVGEDNPDRRYYIENRERISNYYKHRYRNKESSKDAEVLLPCGNDCTNCPYDDGCHYLQDDDVIPAKRPGPTPSLPEADLRQFVRDQFTVPQISRLTGISQKTLRRRCERLGLTPRRAIKAKKEM